VQWAIDARVDTRDREATGDCVTDEVGAGSGLLAAPLLAVFDDGEVTTAAVVSFSFVRYPSFWCRPAYSCTSSRWRPSSTGASESASTV
jgi:hypothetical protein